MDCTNHKSVQQWRGIAPLYLNLWLDGKITIITLSVKKPWITEGDTEFIVVVKQRQMERPFLWLRGTTVIENEHKYLQILVTAEKNGEVSDSYVSDSMKAYDLSIKDFFYLLLQHGFDQYRFAESGDGRHWIFKLRQFFLDRNHMVYADPENTPLETCSPWWDVVEAGQFKFEPPAEPPCWNSRETRERYNALARCLSEAGIN